ncbi:chymotrypsin-1-like [Drosophila pseudoobscura]|uniref:Chymotrypsin-1-like n=1 Tax=Drosophila pseudoobscura pseudoobscura TaxID=46245 RepID=A0A6I8VA69_DROPS|nr:chymotrypsin-1 [Drosophila pseudoobscura]
MPNSHQSVSLLLFALLLALSGLQSCQSAKYLQSRVINGEDAEVGLAPYQVSLQIGGFHFCGGSIITPFWVISAAHCLIEHTPTVVVGVRDLSNAFDAMRYKVKYMTAHCRYELDVHEDDVGLLRVTTAIKFGQFVQPITIDWRPVAAGSKLLTTGWGATSYVEISNESAPIEEYPQILQKLTMTAISLEECQGYYKNNDGTGGVDYGGLCAFFAGGTCSGDSGGPLVLNGRLVGVVSYGLDCGDDIPDVFASMWMYYDYIQTMTRDCLYQNCKCTEPMIFPYDQLYTDTHKEHLYRHRRRRRLS